MQALVPCSFSSSYAMFSFIKEDGSESHGMVIAVAQGRRWTNSTPDVLNVCFVLPPHRGAVQSSASCDPTLNFGFIG